MDKNSEFDNCLKAIHWIILSFALGSFIGYVQGESKVQEKLDSAYLLVSDMCKSELDDANELRNMAKESNQNY